MCVSIKALKRSGISFYLVLGLGQLSDRTSSQSFAEHGLAQAPHQALCHGHIATKFRPSTGCGKLGVHTFDNGIQFCKNSIFKAQFPRYKRENLHEPDESKVFYSLVRRAPPKALFVDIGAAAGYYTLWAVKIQPSMVVTAFNPSKVFQNHLARHFILNFPSQEHVGQICQDTHAVSDVDGQNVFIGEAYGNWINDNATRKRTFTTSITWKTWSQEMGGARPYILMIDIQGVESVVVPQILSDDSGKPDLFVIGTHSASIHSTLRSLVPRSGYEILYDADFGSQRLAPDGSIVAVRKAFARSAEFEALKPHFTAATLRLRFSDYVKTESGW